MAAKFSPRNFSSRRDFLKLGGLSLVTLSTQVFQAGNWFRFYPIGLGRVTCSVINIYKQTSFDSQRVGKHFRDELLTIFEQIHSLKGPERNPIWYRVDRGYIHSAYIQPVHIHPPNALLQTIPENGQLGEVTVPYTQSYHLLKQDRWQPVYRLYYQSIHWITGMDEGPDGNAWYRLKDHLIDTEYHVQAQHIRPISPEEYTPLSTDVPEEEKRILISIDKQILTAFERDRVVFTTSISSGLPDPKKDKNEISTETPLGSFRIQLKMPSRHMGDGHLTEDIEAYELPGVPWTSVFHKTGVALHGTYWHDNFGRRMSHGCVNMRNEDAKWLFRWTKPVYTGQDYYQKGLGTLVIIQ